MTHLRKRFEDLHRRHPVMRGKSEKQVNDMLAEATMHPGVLLQILIHEDENNIIGRLAIRAVQGHSSKVVRPGAMWAFIEPGEFGIGNLVNYTYATYLESILVNGLLPGGLRMGSRKDVYLVPWPAAILDRDEQTRKCGIPLDADIVVTIDEIKVHDQQRLALTAAGCVVVGKTIGPDCIVEVTNRLDQTTWYDASPQPAKGTNMGVGNACKIQEEARKAFESLAENELPGPPTAEQPKEIDPVPQQHQRTVLRRRSSSKKNHHRRVAGSRH
jgi:hypothetical protein